MGLFLFFDGKVLFEQAENYCSVYCGGGGAPPLAGLLFVANRSPPEARWAGALGQTGKILTLDTLRYTRFLPPIAVCRGLELCLCNQYKGFLGVVPELQLRCLGRNDDGAPMGYN